MSTIAVSAPATPVDVIADVASATGEAIKLVDERSTAANTPQVVAGAESAETAKVNAAIAADIVKGDQKAEELDDA